MFQPHGFKQMPLHEKKKCKYINKTIEGEQYCLVIFDSMLQPN